MSKRTSTLTHKLAWIISIKIFFIFLIWWFFVSPHRMKVNDTQVFEHFSQISNSSKEGR
jgi:hypothetical protein